MNILKNKKAETLIEISISLVILSIVLIGITKIFGNAKINAGTVEKRIQAVALAREGIEMVRYIRQLNYIKYAEKKRLCWNFLADNNDLGKGDGEINFETSNEDLECIPHLTHTGSANHIFEDETYFLPLQNFGNEEEKGRYFLSQKGLNLKAIWAKKDDGNIFTDLEIYKLCKDLKTGLISSCESPGLECKDSPGNIVSCSSRGIKKLKFFRTIRIDYTNIFGENCREVSGFCDKFNPKSLNHMKITSTVLWVSSGKVQSVDIVTILSDYEDRKERDS